MTLPLEFICRNPKSIKFDTFFLSFTFSVGIKWFWFSRYWFEVLFHSLGLKSICLLSYFPIKGRFFMLDFFGIISTIFVVDVSNEYSNWVEYSQFSCDSTVRFTSSSAAAQHSTCCDRFSFVVSFSLLSILFDILFFAFSLPLLLFSFFFLNSSRVWLVVQYCFSVDQSNTCKCHARVQWNFVNFLRLIFFMWRPLRRIENLKKDLDQSYDQLTSVECINFIARKNWMPE